MWFTMSTVHVSPDLAPVTHYVTYGGRGPAWLHRGPVLCEVAQRPEETMGGFLTTAGAVITLSNHDAEPCRACMGTRVCGGCLETIPTEGLGASTSKGERCVSCAPLCFHIIDAGTAIGIREEWADGTVVRRINHASVVTK